MLRDSIFRNRPGLDRNIADYFDDFVANTRAVPCS